jgi:hypothetical protein
VLSIPSGNASDKIWFVSGGTYDAWNGLLYLSFSARYRGHLHCFKMKFSHSTPTKFVKQINTYPTTIIWEPFQRPFHAIPRLKIRVNPSDYYFAGLGKFSKTARLTRLHWVMLRHGMLLGFVLICALTTFWLMKLSSIWNNEAQLVI